MAVIATVGTVRARLGKAPQQLLAIVAVCGRGVLEAFKAMWMGEHTCCVTQHLTPHQYFQCGTLQRERKANTVDSNVEIHKFQ